MKTFCFKLTDYAKLDYKNNETQNREPRRIINVVEARNFYYARLSSFIINHSNIEMRNLFCCSLLSFGHLFIDFIASVVFLAGRTEISTWILRSEAQCSTPRRGQISSLESLLHDGNLSHESITLMTLEEKWICQWLKYISPRSMCFNPGNRFNVFRVRAWGIKYFYYTTHKTFILRPTFYIYRIVLLWQPKEKSFSQFILCCV